MNELLVGLGSLVTLEPATGSDDVTCVLRVGAAELRTTLGDDFAVWAMLSRVPRTRAEMHDYIEQLDEPDPMLPGSAEQLDACIDRLREDALVVGVDPDSPRLADLALRVRPVPLYRAVVDVSGSSPAVAIGTATRTVATLDKELAGLWAVLDSVRSVAQIGVGRADADGRTAADDDIRAAFADCLELVARGGAYLDAVI